MMKKLDVRMVGGILAIIVGILLLLQNFGILGVVVALIWALIFAAAVLVFLYVFVTDRVNWWAVIPGLALLGIAALIALDEFWPQVGDAVGGTLFLGALGLAFWIIYFINREHWWAVIPGGVLFTLALIAGLSPIYEGPAMGGVFFLGLGLTFGLLSFLPTPRARMKWALIPAAVLVVIGLLITAITTRILDLLFAAALILVGLYLLLRVFRAKL